MLTKEQKKQSVAKGEGLIGTSKNIVFADFAGMPTADIRRVRVLMRELGGSYTVIKKRLLRIALKSKGIDFDPATKFEGQAAMITMPQEIFEVAGKIQDLIKEFAKAKHVLKILGGIDIAAKKEITAAEFAAIAKLPSRETLLTQIAFMLTMPVRTVMFVLGEKAKKA